MPTRKVIFFIGILIFLFLWNPCAYAEAEKPTEEKPAFELPEVVIIGEDQSKVTIGGEREPLIDQPFLRKVELGLEPMEKISPLSFLPQRKENITEFSFAYGSFNTLKTNLSHGRQIRDKGYYLFGIGKYKTDGEFLGRRYNQDNAFLEWGFKPAEKLDLKIATSGILKDYRLSNSTITQKADLFNVELGVEERIGEGSSLGCQFFGQIANLKNSDKAKSEIGGARLQARIGLTERNLLNLEAHLYQERLKLGGNRRRYLISFISLSDEFLLFDRLWVNLGLEYKEKSKPLTSFLYPTARLSYELIPNFNLWVKYKPGMTVPLFDELYIDNDYTEVNLDILPQKRRFSLEEGMEYKLSQNLSGNISFFQRRFRNFIALFDDDTTGSWQNILNVFSEGVEASFVYNLADFSLREGVAPIHRSVGVADFSLRLRYVYERTEDEDQPDKKVPYRPIHSLKISSRYSYGALEIDLSVLMQSERYYNRSQSLPFYWMLEAEISCRITEQLLIFVQGENLLQEKYAERFSYPLEYSKFSGGLKLKF
ncbi:Vitamin B12 transporter BtuB [subsurface metagenome]|nr:TonB-dependent receptor [Clostridia bacterium]